MRSLLSSLADSTLPSVICFMAAEVSIRGGPDSENIMPKTSALMRTKIHNSGVRRIRLASMYVRGLWGPGPPARPVSLSTGTTSGGLPVFRMRRAGDEPAHAGLDGPVRRRAPLAYAVCRAPGPKPVAARSSALLHWSGRRSRRRQARPRREAPGCAAASCHPSRSPTPTHRTWSTLDTPPTPPARPGRALGLGILAHVDAGKTSLTERFLLHAGVIAEPGSVDDGSTQTDTLALERARGITIKAAVVSFELGPADDPVTVNLVDTPGHSDFIAEVERSLAVLDGAVLVVSAVEGVQAQTRVLMRALQRLGIPTVVFVNKVDRAGADPELVELEVRERLDPDVPVLVGSALTGDGVAELLHALPELLPGREPSTDGPAAGLVFKIDRDDAGGKEVVALLRSGTLRVRDRLDLGRGDPARVTGLRRFHRGGLDTVAEAAAGQVVVLRGLDAARIGDGFGAGAAGMAEEFARPSLATVVEPLDEHDRPALYAALDRLAEQDPLISLRVDGRSGDARELRLSLYGEVQQQVIGSLLEEEYGVAVRFRDT